jgi:hypothetical protein
MHRARMQYENTPIRGDRLQSGHARSRIARGSVSTQELSFLPGVSPERMAAIAGGGEDR